ERIRNEYEVDLTTYVPPALGDALSEGAEQGGENPLAEVEDIDVEAEEGRVPDEAIVDRGADAAGGPGAAPVLRGAPREERELRLRFLGEKLRAMGPVNLLALQDYDERRERLRFLTGQRQDLDDARQSLLEAIEKINGTASQLFLTTFAQLNENFQTVFTSLLEGGEAALLPTGDDPLEAEIEILARPRGKKPQSLSLLSGGEKA